MENMRIGKPASHQYLTYITDGCHSNTEYYTWLMFYKQIIECITLHKYICNRRSELSFTQLNVCNTQNIIEWLIWWLAPLIPSIFQITLRNVIEQNIFPAVHWTAIKQVGMKGLLANRKWYFFKRINLIH